MQMSLNIGQLKRYMIYNTSK